MAVRVQHEPERPEHRRYDVRATRALRVGLAIVLLTCLGAPLSAALGSASVAFLGRVGVGDSDWIRAPERVTAAALPVDAERPRETLFETELPAAADARPFTLRVWALGGVDVLLDGALVSSAPASRSDWRQPLVLEIAEPSLRRLEIRVRNPAGPPLLRADLEPAGRRIGTDTRWQTRSEAGPAPAVIADDTRMLPAALTLPRPGAALLAGRQALLGLFLLGAGCAVLARRVPARWRARAPAFAMIAVALYWISALAPTLARLPLVWGFDVSAHLAYVRYLLENGRLPLATQGGSMYHPPLFYLVEAGLVKALGLPLDGGSAAWPLRLVPFVSGLAQVAFAHVLARRLFARDPARIAVAVLVAGFLPMNLYMSVYLSNESLHAALAGGALCVASLALLDDRLSARRLAAVGTLLGLALSTKYTSLLAVPLVIGLVAWRVGLVEHASIRRGAALLAALVVPLCLLGGGFYVRNVALFGTPVIGNWDLPDSAVGWWQQPGFHTAGYYASFGVALAHPFFAGFASFWDGLYSTLWGDGLLGGVADPARRHGLFDLQSMAAVYALSLPATLLLGLGAARAATAAWSGVAGRERSVFALLAGSSVVLLFGILRMSLQVPSYAQAKAFYALALVAPLALFVADGFGVVDAALARRPWTPLRAGLWGWLAAWLGCIALAFAGP